MRFKSMLGLLAIGGAVAYAQKRRGRDLSLASLKETFTEVTGDLKSKLGGLRGNAVADSSELRSDGVDDNAYSSGFAGSDYSGRSNLRH